MALALVAARSRDWVQAIATARRRSAAWSNGGSPKPPCDQDIQVEQGTTILLVDQNAHFALSLADRGYMMETGRITLEGTGHDLRERPEVQAAYLGM